MSTLIKSFKPVKSYPSLFNSFLNEVDFLPGYQFGSSVPAVNIVETDDDFKIELAAPGIKKEDFKINVNDKVLSISSETEESKEEKYTRKEFSYSSFKRSFNLPETVDSDKIEASYTDGVLLLVLPKKEEAKPKEPRLINVG